MSTYAATAAAPIALARMIALRVNVAARPVLFVLAVVVITLGIGVAMGQLPVLMLIGHGHIHVSAATGVNQRRYTRPRKRQLPVQKREQKEAMEKPDEEAVHSSCN